MRKYFIYLNERFPLQTHILFVLVFTFSAISYSIHFHDEQSFIPLSRFFGVFFLTVSCFFLLRISDEFKDHEDDMKYRKYLPVPRGLITLKELKNWAFIVIALQVVVLFFIPRLIPLYLICMVYMFFMYHEFFVASWLKNNQVMYVLTHMMIIAFVDLLASGAHWTYYSDLPPQEIQLFITVSFFNGMVLEIGRKIKPQKKEEYGVVSYSKLYGEKGATLLWIGLLSLTYLISLATLYVSHSPTWSFYSVSAFFIVALIPPFLFLKTRNESHAKLIEHISGIWTIGMYLNIGALPYLLQ